MNFVLVCLIQPNETFLKVNYYCMVNIPYTELQIKGLFTAHELNN